MNKKSSYILEKPKRVLTTGRTIAILRELKGWTQGELASRSKISATNISLLENDKVDI